MFGTRGGVPSPMPAKAAGILYGLGLGGFIDGTVLHQILQWHHMLIEAAESSCSSARSPSMVARSGAEV